MIDTLLSLAAPHHCCHCGVVGTLLCENCKYDIVSEPFDACVSCGKQLAAGKGLCGGCRVPYARAWCVADRRDYLQKLIDDFKFSNAKAAHRHLAQLLHERLPDLPSNTVLVPVPTVSSHIRQRGYDHALLVARQLARLRRLPCETSLRRVTSTTQRGSGVRQRDEQARKAFACHASLRADKTYLLIDDVVTSGATMRYAAQTLRDAGAGEVWVATISRQPLD